MRTFRSGISNAAWPGRIGDPWRRSRNSRTTRATASRQSDGLERRVNSRRGLRLGRVLDARERGRHVGLVLGETAVKDLGLLVRPRLDGHADAAPARPDL